MAIKNNTFDFSDCAKERLLRINYKTLSIGQEIRINILKSSKTFERLKEFFNITSGYAFKSEDYVHNDGVPTIRIGDVGNYFDESNMVFLPEEYKKSYSKYLLKKNDIVVSLTGEGKLKSDLIIEDSKYLLNQRVGCLRPKFKTNVQFYYYLLNNLSLVKKQFYWWSNGKTQLNISPFDFLNIRIPIIDEETQKQIVASIEPIENEVTELKSKLKSFQKVIDEVFTREFEFNIGKFQELSKIKNYNANFSDFANNIDIRYSVKFHRDAGKFVLEELKKISTKKIKHFIAEPIMLGASVSPSDYDENGDYYYISMANIKNWKFESEDTKLVSNDYSKNNQNKTVAKNDILIARSGEGTIGKVALIQDEELLGVYADFTMRIRLKNYNPTFAYYYFRTTYFQYLVEIHKKGLGNNTNIFPSQIQEFPIIDISISRQEKIVEEIKKEIDKQENIKVLIEQERTKIDEIIAKAIL